MSDMKSMVKEGQFWRDVAEQMRRIEHSESLLGLIEDFEAEAPQMIERVKEVAAPYVNAGTVLFGLIVTDKN